MLKNKYTVDELCSSDQIIPINGMLKNDVCKVLKRPYDQIIPINGMLKNAYLASSFRYCDQIIPINGMLKNAYQYD